MTRHLVAAIVLTAAALASLANCSFAAARNDPALLAKAVAPYLDEQTIGVAYLDLTRFELSQLTEQFRILAPVSDEEEGTLVDAIKRWRDVFHGAGFHDIYLVVSLADFPMAHGFVITIKQDGSNSETLRKDLGAMTKSYEVHELPGAVFVGADSTWERLKSVQPHECTALTDAFRAIENAGVQVLLLPTQNDRRVIEELLPVLPKSLGGGPSTVLTHGVRWAALGVDLSPKLAVKLVIQSEPGAAAPLLAKWPDLARWYIKWLAPTRIEQAAPPLFPTPELRDDRLVLALDAKSAKLTRSQEVLALTVVKARDEYRRAQTISQLHQLGLAMQTFHDANKRFPGVGTVGAGGKPLLSWRVQLLPYIGRKDLYERFRLGEPWNSEHNHKLIAEMPAAFRTPGSKYNTKEGLSNYQVVVGTHTAFPDYKGLRVSDIEDGISNTILIVEADDAHASVWTKPEGLPYVTKDLLASLGGHFARGFYCVAADAAVHFVPLSVAEPHLNWLIGRDDGFFRWPDE